MMDWFTIVVSLGSAALVLAAAVFIYLFASSFFMQQPYSEWLIVSGGLVLLGLSMGARPFVEGLLSDAVVGMVVTGSVIVAVGFGQAYRRSAGGI